MQDSSRQYLGFYRQATTEKNFAYSNFFPIFVARAADRVLKEEY